MPANFVPGGTGRDLFTSAITCFDSGNGSSARPVISRCPLTEVKPINVYAIYASRQYLDVKIRTLVEFLRDTVPQRVAAHEQELGLWHARYGRSTMCPASLQTRR